AGEPERQDTIRLVVVQLVWIEVRQPVRQGRQACVREIPKGRVVELGAHGAHYHTRALAVLLAARILVSTWSGADEETSQGVVRGRSPGTHARAARASRPAPCSRRAAR